MTNTHEISLQTVQFPHDEYLEKEHDELIAHYMRDVLRVTVLDERGQEAVIRHQKILRLLKSAENLYQAALLNLWEQYESGGWITFVADGDATFQDYVEQYMQYPDEDNATNRVVRDLSAIVTILLPYINANTIFDAQQREITVPRIIQDVPYTKMRRAVQVFFVVNNRTGYTDVQKDEIRSDIVGKLVDGKRDDIRVPTSETKYDVDPNTGEISERKTPLPPYRLIATSNRWQIEFLTPLDDTELRLLQHALSGYTQEA